MQARKIMSSTTFICFFKKLHNKERTITDTRQKIMDFNHNDDTAILSIIVTTLVLRNSLSSNEKPHENLGLTPNYFD